MGEFPGSIDYFVDPSRTFIGQNSQTAIVCHGTGGSANQTAQQLGDFFRTTPAMTSVHYGIDRAGVICQYVPESAGAGGNGILDPGHDPFWDQFGGDNPNIHTLSFETINDGTNSLPLTDPQKQTVFKLIKYWVDKYDIPLSNIKGHFTLQPVERHNCPGQQFPWDELFNYLKGDTMDSVLNHGWTDDGTTLKAPNGIPVVQGFRDTVLNSNWDANNWPLEDESHQTILEQSNPSLGDGQAQTFRWTRLEYTPKTGTIEGWLGQELLWYQKQYPQLLAKIADLQQQLNKDTQAQQIAALQTENAKLKALLASSNLGQINTVGKQISDAIAIILKLSQVQ